MIQGNPALASLNFFQDSVSQRTRLTMALLAQGAVSLQQWVSSYCVSWFLQFTGVRVTLAQTFPRADKKAIQIGESRLHVQFGWMN